MEVIGLSIPDVKLIKPRRFADARGFFAETFSRRRFVEAGLVADFVQDNQSLSRPAGTVRGLHFQRAPHGQAKLVRVLRGAIFDVALDIRPGSATYGQHVALELTAEDGAMILVPEGFAHGVCTLTANTEILYKVNRDYAPEQEGGILWNDPALGIAWPVDPAGAVLSERDRKWPTLSEYTKAVA
jgi:dTDP-4-dehydrorhamnose 3,5-epimerase